MRANVSSSAMTRQAAILALLTMASFVGGAETPEYRSVLIDGGGQLHIGLSSGGEILPAKLPGQVAFGEALLSQDHKTVGWLAYYPYPGDSNPPVDPIPGRLVLYQSGHVLRTFPTGQIFWSWQFANGDREVAYCTGPTHGGAGECELHDLKSGNLVERWFPKEDDRPPDWTKGLRY